MTRWGFDAELPQHELVTLGTFEKHSEYLIARGLLESAGIECFGRDEHSTRINSGAAVTALQVRKSDAEDAAAILDAPAPTDGFTAQE